MNTKFLIGGVVMIAIGLLMFGKFSNSNTTSGIASIHNRISGDATNLAPDFTLQKFGGDAIQDNSDVVEKEI